MKIKTNKICFVPFLYFAYLSIHTLILRRYNLMMWSYKKKGNEKCIDEQRNILINEEYKRAIMQGNIYFRAIIYLIF